MRFCLLLGIVENGKPRFAGVFNYVTKEIVLIDSDEPTNFIREGKSRDLKASEMLFLDQRYGGKIEDELRSASENITIMASLGLRAVYASLDGYRDVCVFHGVQSCGLWDILPGAVVAKLNQVEIYDNSGSSLVFDKYITLPNIGVTLLKGDKFRFILSGLKS